MRKLSYILILILAGEIIFSLPFHTARFFRPTLLEAFQISNTQLGDVFAVYGVLAMLSYFPGGILADRFPPGKLIAVSLWATAAGGVYMTTYPGPAGLALLYGYWGVTTILLFWASLISATRSWGSHSTQGLSFGILDGGRGLLAAGLALIAVQLLAEYLPFNAADATMQQRTQSFRMVIWLYTAVTALAGLVAWFGINLSYESRAGDRSEVQGRGHRPPTTRVIGEMCRTPTVWAQAGIIVCAYSCYKGLDNTSLYAVQVLGMNEVEAARFTAWASYLRPVAAIVAGLIADRLTASSTLGVAYLLLIACFFIMSVSPADPQTLHLMLANVLISFFAVFALRGIYFALLEETAAPIQRTGTTVGIISFVGFTPEIFFSPITGRILDHSPGIAGHQDYYLFLAITAALGAAFSLLLVLARRSHNARQAS